MLKNSKNTLRKCSKLSSVKRFVSTNEYNKKIEPTFENDFHNFHIPISDIQRIMLGVGSSFMSLLNPYRAGKNNHM